MSNYPIFTIFLLFLFFECNSQNFITNDGMLVSSKGDIVKENVETVAFKKEQAGEIIVIQGCGDNQIVVETTEGNACKCEDGYENTITIDDDGEY